MKDEGMPEPKITINGHELTEAQAMAVRAAITAFHAETSDPKALGDDEHGVRMCAAYWCRLDEVLGFIIPRGPSVTNGERHGD